MQKVVDATSDKIRPIIGEGVLKTGVYNWKTNTIEYVYSHPAWRDDRDKELDVLAHRRAILEKILERAIEFIPLEELPVV